MMFQDERAASAYAGRRRRAPRGAHLIDIAGIAGAATMRNVSRGVISVALAHGLLGLYLGPVVISVFHELVVAWTRLGATGQTPESGAH
ncbi:MAG TPA: hypothetical protein PLH75_03715 [Amaricoccus sp.]|nr:hypothetical protein [Amaricoccus sp.]